MPNPSSGLIDNYNLRFNWGTNELEMNTGNEVWVPVPINTTEVALAHNKMFVGNANGLASAVTPSGGFTIADTGVATLGNTAVTGQPITGYVSGAGTVSATDTILQAIQKLNGNAGAAATFADGEVPTGLINSSNVTYTLANTPNPSTSLHLYLNGVRQSASGDYTLSTATITMTTAPTTGSVLLADYRY